MVFFDYILRQFRLKDEITGGAGLETVARDSTLVGDGTLVNPMGVALSHYKTDFKSVKVFDAFTSLAVIDTWLDIPGLSVISGNLSTPASYIISANVGLRTFNNNTEIQLRLAVDGVPLDYSLRANRRPNSGTAIFGTTIFAIPLQGLEELSPNSTVTVQWNTNIAPVEFKHGSMYIFGVPNVQKI